MTNVVSTERADGRATIWLDRPDKRNALDGQLMRELAAALDAVRDDPAVRVVVRGEAPKRVLVRAAGPALRASDAPMPS